MSSASSVAKLMVWGEIQKWHPIPPKGDSQESIRNMFLKKKHWIIRANDFVCGDVHSAMKNSI